MSDFTAKMHQIRLRLGLRPTPRWGSFQRSPGPLAVGEGASCPLSKNPASALGPSGLDTSSPGYNNFSPDLGVLE